MEVVQDNLATNSSLSFFIKGYHPTKPHKSESTGRRHLESWVFVLVFSLMIVSIALYFWYIMRKYDENRYESCDSYTSRDKLSVEDTEGHV